MVLSDFGCFLIDSSRSRAYIQKLAGNSFIPRHVIYIELDKKKKAGAMIKDPAERIITEAMKDRKYFLYDSALKGSSLSAPPAALKPRMYASFHPEEPVPDTLRKHNIEHTVIKAGNINGPAVTDALGKCGPTYFLFGGGGILGKPLFETGKRFLHLHPGHIPFFRGSHCIEWSVLRKGRCAVTAFIINEVIDGGDIIAHREFDPPVGLEHGNIPRLYSAHIRSELMLDVIKDYARTDRFETVRQDLKEGETYYKMHPAITNLVFHKINEMGKGKPAGSM